MSVATATLPPCLRMLDEHTRVCLLRALPTAGLAVGAIGTIVHVYHDGYEVEFTKGRKHPVIETLFPVDVEALIEGDEWI